jgi:hypothetical protein
MVLCAGKELTHVEVRHDVGEGKKFAVRKRSVACVVLGHLARRADQGGRCHRGMNGKKKIINKERGRTAGEIILNINCASILSDQLGQGSQWIAASASC